MVDYKAVVVDSHVLIAKSAEMLLSLFEDISSTYMAASGEECLAIVKQFRPDLFIIDFNLKDMLGIDLIKEIRKMQPTSKIVIFTGIDMSDKLEMLYKDVKINAYISKKAGLESVKSTIRCLLDGFSLVPDQYLSFVQMPAANPIQLSPDEIQIMQLMVSGKTYTEISEFIHVSQRTVNNYVKRIFEKLGAGSRVQAISLFLTMMVE